MKTGKTKAQIIAASRARASTVVEMRDSGMRLRDIAPRLGVSVSRAQVIYQQEMRRRDEDLNPRLQHEETNPPAEVWQLTPALVEEFEQRRRQKAASDMKKAALEKVLDEVEYYYARQSLGEFAKYTDPTKYDY